MNRLLLRQTTLCEEVQANLGEYLSDELDTKTHAAVTAHVTFCKKCQDEIRLIQAINEALGELPKPKSPPQVFNTIAAYVRTNVGKKRPWWSHLFPLSFSWKRPGVLLAQAGALLTLLAVFVFGIYQYQKYVKIRQATHDLHYALGKLSYAVERTGIVFTENLPEVPKGFALKQTFTRIERVSHSVFQQNQNISSAIQRGLNRLDNQFSGAGNTENYPNPGMR